MKIFWILFFGLVTVSLQDRGRSDEDPSCEMTEHNMPRGGWRMIKENDKNLVGLAVRGINFINNLLGLMPGFKFVKISGKPMSQAVFGNNYNATVVMRLKNVTTDCRFFMYRQPISPPEYLDITSYTIGCLDGQNFNFTVSVPTKKNKP